MHFFSLFSECWRLICFICFVLSLSRHMFSLLKNLQIKFIKLPVGVNMSMNGCLTLYVNPVMSCGLSRVYLCSGPIAKDKWLWIINEWMNEWTNECSCILDLLPNKSNKKQNKIILVNTCNLAAYLPFSHIIPCSVFLFLRVRECYQQIKEKVWSYSISHEQNYSYKSVYSKLRYIKAFFTLYTVSSSSESLILPSMGLH